MQVDRIAELTTKINAAWIKTLNDITSKVEKAILESHQIIPEIAKKYNWFIEPSLKTVTFRQLLAAKQASEVDEILIKHYKNNAVRILADLKKDFPNRSDIFDEIFFAHNNGLYYLSCIAFMTQVDGVVYDTFKGKNYFQGDFFGTNRDALIEINEESIKLYFLKQLFNDELPIKLSFKKRNEMKIEHLNRHQILHGESTNFSSEINSLKALSLLAAMAFSLKYFNDILSTKKEEDV